MIEKDYNGAISIKYWQRKVLDTEVKKVLTNEGFEYKGRDIQTDSWFAKYPTNIRKRKGNLEDYTTVFYTMHPNEGINRCDMIFEEYEVDPDSNLIQRNLRTREIYTKETDDWKAKVRLMPTSQIIGNDSRLGEIEVIFYPEICKEGLEQIKTDFNNFLETLGIKEDYRVPSYSYP